MNTVGIRRRTANGRGGTGSVRRSRCIVCKPLDGRVIAAISLQVNADCGCERCTLPQSLRIARRQQRWGLRACVLPVSDQNAVMHQPGAAAAAAYMLLVLIRPTLGRRRHHPFAPTLTYGWRRWRRLLRHALAGRARCSLLYVCRPRIRQALERGHPPVDMPLLLGAEVP